MEASHSHRRLRRHLKQHRPGTAARIRNITRSKPAVGKVEVGGVARRKIVVEIVERSKIEVEVEGSSTKHEAVNSRAVLPTGLQIQEMALRVAASPGLTLVDCNSKRKIHINNRTVNLLCLIYRRGRL